LIGRQRVDRENSDENANLVAKQSKKTLIERVDDCENSLAKIETKALKIEETLIKLMEVIQQ
jgi:hypothetical protein